MRINESAPSAILLEDIRYIYPDQKLAIDGISCQISQGEKVAFIGPNAAGKSTLIMLLNGVLRGEGSIHIFGMKLSKKSENTIKSNVQSAKGSLSLSISTWKKGIQNAS